MYKKYRDLNRKTSREDLYYFLDRYGADYKVIDNPTEEQISHIRRQIEKSRQQLNK